jgi:WD40 repeat protein
VEKLDKDASGPFGSVTSTGQTLQTINVNGWVNHLNFSPDCNTLCFVTHDCEVNFANVSDGAQGDKIATEKVFHRGNPHMTCVFLSNDRLVAGGYDKTPYVYERKGTSWSLIKTMDDGVDRQRKAKITGNSFLDKKVYFNSDFKLNSNVEMRETDTKHANFINCMMPYASDESGKPLVLASSDVNGYLIFWDVKAM